MVDLIKLYDKLPAPREASPNSFTAKTIKGYKNHRIAKNFNDNPSLLILISEKKQDFFISNQNLFNIKVTHNVNCKIDIDNKISHNNFSVVSYTGNHEDEKGVFLKTCQVLIESLGQNPSNKEIKYTVDKFIDLFRTLKEPPKKSIQGLWSELFIIEQSDFPAKIISSWHNIPEEQFDFSFGKQRLEVKSSATESRIHYFSSSQLNPSNDTRILIASILVNTNVAGVSVRDLIEKISTKSNNFPKQKEKLHFLAFSTIGSDIEQIENIKFDYELAKKSLRFYDSEVIPKISDGNIPKEVSKVKFVSNLVNSEPLQIDIDSLLIYETKS